MRRLLLLLLELKREKHEGNASVLVNRGNPPLQSKPLERVLFLTGLKFMRYGSPPRAISSQPHFKQQFSILADGGKTGRKDLGLRHRVVGV